MALINQLELEIMGIDSECLSDETKHKLGELMAFLLYNELDKAVAMLLNLDNAALSNLEFSAGQLMALCKIAKKGK